MPKPPYKTICRAYCIARRLYLYAAGRCNDTDAARFYNDINRAPRNIICFDRWPFSLRMVAASALLVLMLSPSALLSPSFQLSFSAVTALIYTLDTIKNKMGDTNKQSGSIRKLWLYILGIMLTSLVAGISTSIFALYHFQSIALYGIAANMFAIPLMSFIIMPLGILALLFMPMNLDYIPFKIMEQGIKTILDIAEYISSLDHSVLYLPAFNLSALILFTLCALCYFIIHGKIRYYISAAIFMAFMINIKFYQHDILISSKFELIGISNGSHLYVSDKNKNGFTRDNWLSYLGYQENQYKAWHALNSIKCDVDACQMTLKGHRIAIIKKPYALEKSCRNSDIALIAYDGAQQNCSAKHIITKQDIRRKGPLAISLLEKTAPHYVYTNKNEKRLWGM